MTLMECHECKNSVSDEAKTCPHCGAKVKKVPPSWAKNTVNFIVGVIVLVVLVNLFSGDDEEVFINNDSEITREDQEKLQQRIQIFSGKNWPFVVNEVSVGCFEDTGPNAVIRVDEGEMKGQFFALNGPAMQHLPSAKGIKEMSQDGLYISHSTFIDVAISLCADKESYWYTVTFNPEDEILNLAINWEGIKTPRQVVLDKVDSQFSSWNGEHRNLARLIKQSMHDPDSYDHDETVYWIMKDHLVVRTTYRGKNAFGAKIKNSTKAKVSFDGQILSIMQ